MILYISSYTYNKFLHSIGMQGYFYIFHLLLMCTFEWYERTKSRLELRVQALTRDRMNLEPAKFL